MAKKEMGGKCPRQYCTEVAGHAGPCTGDFLPYADLRTQLQQAQEEYERDTRALQSVWDDFHIVEQKRDEAIARGVQAYEYALYLISLTRLAEASRWLIGTRLRTERERAEAAEGLAGERLTIIHNIDLGLQALLKTPADKPHSIERQWLVDLSMRLAGTPAEA